MKTVSTTEYISALRELTEQGLEVSVPIRGGSMVPFLVDGRDEAFFRKPEKALKRGDIVFYQRPDGVFVLHRLKKIADNRAWMIGDAQTVVEGPLPASVIFAVVTAVKRKGKMIGPDNRVWRFFSGFWLAFYRLRPLFTRCYSFCKRMKTKIMHKNDPVR